jgi:hypothetical protein
MLLQWPDLFYHTSMDTIDKVSEDSLRRVGWIATVAALTLANATSETAFQFANETALRGAARITEASHKAIGEFFAKKGGFRLKQRRSELARELAKTAVFHRNRIGHIVWREQQAIRSVKRFGEDLRLNTLIKKCCKDIIDLGKKEMARLGDTLEFVTKTAGLRLLPKLEDSKTDRESKQQVPRRLFRGTLSLEVIRKGLGEKEYEWYVEILEQDVEFEKKMAEILNFMDGKRSMYEIVQAVSAEYSETSIKDALKFLRDLEKLSLVSFK